MERLRILPNLHRVTRRVGADVERRAPHASHGPAAAPSPSDADVTAA
jgi:hypothetical protein